MDVVPATAVQVAPYYSPPQDTPVDDPSRPAPTRGDGPFVGTEADWKRFEGDIRLSRFRLVGDTLDMASEQHIIDVPVDRGIRCHVGGDIVFDADGNLYLSTGDDTHPFQSDGYTPIDERPERNRLPRQRSSGNTNDLWGKVLRITPLADALHRPGRQPLRTRGHAPRSTRWGSATRSGSSSTERPVSCTSPTTRPTPKASPLRGPAGQGKWTVVPSPANYGWPYCATAELPYVDCDAPGGVAGVLRREAALLRVDCDYVKALTLDANGDLASIEPVIDSLVTDNPMDLEFGPDGALYVLEYGDGCFAENPDAQLARIDYVGVGGNRSPVPVVSAEPAAVRRC